MSLHVPIRQLPMFPHDHIFLRPSHMPLRQAGALQELGSSRRDNVVLLSWFSRMTCALAQLQDFRAYESHSKFNAQPQTHCARCEVISMMWCDEQSSSRK
ncbi:hypothetical protein DY000_02037545 [Brassica cretica]|uniref:Uncharacterized protein n=1 Tax=Brassica cretica TaxID=69181 RepID=A0ABQ7BFI5_BRACR|nr:hypothetical protein DY000_02037545 [Brassica cretica]